MKLHHKIVSILLVVAIFAFNLVLLPAEAMEGCACDHPHGEDGFACFCGTSSLKPPCEGKEPSFSKGHCGLDKKSRDFSIPAHEYPSLLSSDDSDLKLHLSILNTAGIKFFSNADLLPTERPPSIL